MKWFFDPCRNRRKQISLWLAGVLTENEARPVQQHLQTCAECRQFYAETKSVSASLNSWQKSLATVTANEQFQVQWKQALRTANRESQDVRREQVPTSWHEWLVSLRWHLTGLSALWVLIAFLNMEPSASSSSTIAQRQNKPSTEQIVASLRENRRRIQELMEPPTAPAPTANVPQTSLPRRRSEIEPQIEMV